MLTESLRKIFENDIARFKDEIKLYKNDEHLWKLPGGISNSAGTIALHLIGNLNHWIGNIIGKSGYVRDRDSEFTIRNVPREEILRSIDDTIISVRNALTMLKQEDLGKIFPSDVLEKEVTTDHYLIYLISHLNYHVGQINYHRRLTE